MKRMKNIKINYGFAHAKGNDGKQQVIKLFVALMITMASYPGFSQTRQAGSILSDNRRSVVSSSYSQSATSSYAQKTSASYAQSASASGKRQSAFIHFRNVSSEIDPSYLDNARVLASLDRLFSDNSIIEKMDYATITGSASPDGYSDRNERLAEERAYALKNYIMRKNPQIDGRSIIVHSNGEDWEGLRQLIEADYTTPGRNEALQILNSSLSSGEKRKRLQQVNSGRTYKYLSDNMFPQLRGGVAYMIFMKDGTVYTEANGNERATNKNVSTVTGNMANYNIIADHVNITNNNIFNDDGLEGGISRNTERKTDYNTGRETNSGTTVERNTGREPNSGTIVARNTGRETNSGTTVARNTGRETNSGTIVERNTDRETSSDAVSRYTVKQRPQITQSYNYGQPQEKMHLAVKTNLLFDAATALNFELETPIGKSWSLAGEYIFPWWLWEDKQNAFQLISGSLELRHWFGDRDNRAQLTGWYGGLSLGGGYYDLEKDRKGYQGEFFLPFVSGGFAHEISRNGRWRMEYALGLGYMRTKYREYSARTGLDNEWHLIYQKSGTYKYLGPVRAKISLVFTLNSYR